MKARDDPGYDKIINSVISLSNDPKERITFWSMMSDWAEELGDMEEAEWCRGRLADWKIALIEKMKNSES